MPFTLPTRDELLDAARRYFVPGTWTEATIDALERRLRELRADDARWRGRVSAFVANPVGRGAAWREDRGPEPRGPEVLDVALMVLATECDGVVARPYTPDALVGTWELVERADGEPVGTPAPRWRLLPDGRLAAAGYVENGSRWAVHRARIDELWIFAPRKKLFLVACANADALELGPVGQRGRLDRWRRVGPAGS